MNKKCSEKFWRRNDGGFAVLTVFTFPVIMASVILALDIANLVRAKTELQDANDSAALFATRTFQETSVLPGKESIKGVIEANLTDKNVFNIMPVFEKTTNVLTLTSSLRVEPMLMGYLGLNNNTVSALSKAEVGVSSVVEFALALDTTLSMNDDGRIAGLKIAANDFVARLFDQKDRGGNVKGAIVPFSNYVNVGVSRRSANWMNIPADIDTRGTTNVCSTTNPVVGTTNCRMETTQGFTRLTAAIAPSCWTSDGYKKCNSGSPATSTWIPAKTSRVCDNVLGPAVTNCVPKTTGSLVTWSGCVSSRSYPDNVKEVFGSRKFPGVIGVNCAAELQPLTDSRTALVNKINSLTPANDTYIVDGVMWGIRVLTNSEPFSEGLASLSTGTLRKALVIMTDGKNSISPQLTSNPRSGNRIFHNGTNSALSDAYLLEACAEAKAQGIEVYTISFGSDVDNSIKKLLTDCASQTEMNFYASDSVGLSAAFATITNSLLAVRLIE